MYKIRTLNSKFGTALLAGLLSSALPLTDLIAQEQQLADSTGQPTVLEEVLVTAMKRTADVQDVAASISVQSGDLLIDRNQTQLTDYAINVPGLNVSNLGKAGLTQVNLRGIASVSNSASVGAYIDEVPLGSSSRYGNGSQQILDVLPYDLDRIEVLRGPQGTLYGAGTMGGLIKYVLKSASSTEFASRVGGEIGTIDGAGKMSYAARAMVNVPLAQDIAGLRVSVYNKYTPGFIDNAFTGETDVNKQNRYGGRAALLWTPSDTVSVKLSALLSHNKADDGATVSNAEFDFIPTTDGASIGVSSGPYGDLTQNHAFPQGFREKAKLFTATIDWSPGSLNIVSATSWSNRDTHLTVDQTTAIIPFIELGIFPPGTLLGGATDLEVEKFTQELRIGSSEGERFDWLVGGFYTDERVRVDLGLDAFFGDYTPFLTPALSNRERSSYEEWAFFGDVILHVNDKFDLSAGLRYADITQEYDSVPGGPFGGFPTTSPPTGENVTTWSFSASYHVTSDTMLYGRVATGYRAGGLNPLVIFTPGVAPSVDSDSLTSYELGVKTRFHEDRGLFNLTAFFIDWKDIQLNSTQGGNTILTNGGDAEPKGFELTLAYAASQNLSVGFNAAYTDSEIKSTAPGAFFVPGYQLPGVPKVSYSLTADYDWTLANGWNANIGAGYRWVDKQWLTGVQLLGFAAPSLEADSYSTLNFNASLTRGPWTIRAYVTNLTNDRSVQGGLQLIDVFNRPQQGDFWIAQPLAMGVGFDYRF